MHDIVLSIIISSQIHLKEEGCDYDYIPKSRALSLKDVKDENEELKNEIMMLKKSTRDSFDELKVLVS